MYTVINRSFGRRTFPVPPPIQNEHPRHITGKTRLAEGGHTKCEVRCASCVRTVNG